MSCFRAVACLLFTPGRPLYPVDIAAIRAADDATLQELVDAAADFVATDKPTTQILRLPKAWQVARRVC